MILGRTASSKLLFLVGLAAAVLVAAACEASNPKDRRRPISEQPRTSDVAQMLSRTYGQPVYQQVIVPFCGETDASMTWKQTSYFREGSFGGDEHGLWLIEEEYTSTDVAQRRVEHFYPQPRADGMTWHEWPFRYEAFRQQSTVYVLEPRSRATPVTKIFFSIVAATPGATSPNTGR